MPDLVNTVMPDLVKTVMPDLIGHLKLKNYDRKSDLPYGIRGFHDDV